MSRTPIPSFRLCLLAALAAAPGAFAQTAPGPAAAGPGDRVVLPEFAVVESRLARDAALSPANVPLDSLFAPGLTIGEVPRSVSVVTPEAMATFGIRSFADLEKAGPGTARLNYFGIAGTPILRGTEAGVYFDGMLRAYQRNEMPVSFESLERLDVVRGAAPAQFTPTPIGGFVNFVPKAPFFDQPHEGIEVSGGSGDFSRAQADVGGPQPGGRAAWRATATVQRDGTPYRNLRNDYESVYAVATFRPADGVTATVGAEYYDYRSNENLGWNRVTADLIDRGAYVRGEPADLTSAAWGGKVTRTLLEFPYSSLVNPRLHSLAVSGAIARAQIPDALRATMIDLNDPAQVAALYVLRADADVPAFLKADPALYAQRRATAQAALDLIARHPQDAFVYTPQYFAAGGTALTTTLARDRVLADPDDFANARNALLFFNWENTRDPALTWKNQVFLETLATRKYSSYGYATQTGQVVLSDKFTLVRNLPAWRSRLTAGAELRAVSSLMRQDYAAEVFGRRDLSADTLSANSLIPAGATPAPDGLNLWSTSAGANLRSREGQAGLFGNLETIWTRWLVTHTSVRAEGLAYHTTLPSGIDRATAALASSLDQRDHTGWLLGAFQPVIALAPGLRAYAALQHSTAVDPAQGGAIYGRANFSKARFAETGVKAELGRAFVGTLCAYHWEQSNYNSRDAQAEPVEGRGAEAELIWEPGRRFSLEASATAQRQYYRGATVGFGAIPRSAQDWALTGGIFSAAGSRTFPNNPEMIYPAYPELSSRLAALAQLSGGWSVSGAVTWRDGFWANFDRTLRLPSSVVCDAGLAYERAGWRLRLSVENLFDRHYFIGSAPVFTANSNVTPAPGLTWRATLRLGF